jgi:CubicO group peptidase (beta-lactamase class C family)
MTRRLFQLLGVLCLAGFIYLNMNYWDDPVFWRRWWNTVTHLEPDHMNFSPTVEVRSSSIHEFPTVDPDRLTVAPEALRATEAYAAEMESFALVVVHRGLVQTEWYAPGWNRDRLTQSQSMNKTVSALMMGVAIADGFVSSTEDMVSAYLPEWQSDSRGEITIENLLVMSSGLVQTRFTLNPFAADSSFRFLFSRERAPVVLDIKLEWRPGSKFDYNDINAQLVGMIVERAVGKPYAEYLQEKLWEPLGGQHAELWLDQEDGLAMTACCLLGSPVDWAKIGLLMKDGGRFNGQQIIAEEWIERMITPSARYPGYGYLTWLGAGVTDDANSKPDIERNKSERFLARDMFYLSGYGGQRVYVSRENDLVIVRLGPFAGMQPLNPDWDNAYLLNTIIRGIRDIRSVDADS